jgi:hypothetical protein
MREPAVALIDDAGLEPERPGDPALAFPCRNAPVEVLIVCAAKVRDVSSSLHRVHSELA